MNEPRDDAALKAREDAVAVHEKFWLQDALRKLDALTAKMDSFEAERAKDPDDDELPLPPGTDAGEDQKAPGSEDQNSVETP